MFVRSFVTEIGLTGYASLSGGGQVTQFMSELIEEMAESAT